MDDNSICREVRKLLSDRSKGNLSSGFANEKRNIHIASVGGGPGYDHVALWIAFMFILNMNNGFVDDSERIILTTDVYDLYGEWDGIVQHMNICMNRSMGIISEEVDRTKLNTNLFDEGSGARTKLCDIREGLDHLVNKELSESLENTDIICFSFVIHENASSILSNDDNDDKIRGAARDIMERSQIGTIIICMDSTNTCWPSFKNTAEYFGWEHFSSLEKVSKISFGPKNFVIFRRVSYGIHDHCTDITNDK